MAWMTFMRTVWMSSLLATVLLAAESETFVTAQWLAEHRADSNVFILDARPEAEYAKGHIPGALPVNTYDYLVESTPQGEKALQQWIIETFSRAGIGPDDNIIVYEDKLGIRAARAYWALCYAGQPVVKMLEGGLESWRQSKLAVSTDATPPRAATKYKFRPQKKWLASATDIAALGKERKSLILDVRSRDEYEGKGGSADCARQGRIPGAKWMEWTQFLAPDGKSVLSAEKLGVMLMEHGITPDKQIVVYCHRGARAAMVWAVLDDLGYPKVRNYVGSWHDWAAQKQLPVEK